MSKHSIYSSYRETLIEHLFISELLKISWKMGDCSLEVAKPEVDNSGYDLIVEREGVVRHIQLKSSYLGGRTSTQKVHTKLSNKPAGCVIWLYFDESTLDLGPFLYFGGRANEPLPSLVEAKIARHTKGDHDGYKAERPMIREINKGMFSKYSSIVDLYNVLFDVSDLHE
ncbi:MULTISPECIES: hypothetical protein [Marinomonas]|uniref:PD(D/E)XK endonuclease domain-containing protein n=1 Tax=Marinomonas arctica TaxID=383750 RepID=A0A7H1J6N6_9GAMM|nr:MULTISPECIES: hypothetical protein [Marinomonas]MCS7485129.1 hypothetical protein [Marinomonas sp. BSi20414]QNT06152.1 hypothetical protein IBG28_00365 [Marinomonas arctica]GGN18372.1 hypothetical protein GCM10011350_04550 [Marinomonas arctica]